MRTRFPLPIQIALLLFLAGCATALPDSIQPQPLPTRITGPRATVVTSPLPPPVTPTAPATVLPPATLTRDPPTTAPLATDTPFSPAALSAALPGTMQGFELVGHAALGGAGWHAGLALYDDCAYVGNRRSGAAAIVDTGNPAEPAVIGQIPFGSDGQPVELRVLQERALLVAADFGNGRLLTYDVSQCAAPEPLATVTLPGAPHEFYLWTDGEQVLLYGAMFDQAPADLMVIDLGEPAQPEIVGEWFSEAEGIAGLLHSLSFSPDGSRAYLALWHGGVVVADVDGPHLRVLRDDTGAARPAAFVAAHSVVPLPDPAYLLVTNELWRCPFSPIYVVSIADPVRPHVVANLALPENRCEGLPAGDAVYNPHNPLVVGNLAFVSWYSAGLQVIDVTDPLQPERVAQFVPGVEGAAPFSYIGSYPVQTWSYPILRNGLLYVVDIQSGLYILRYTGPGADAITAVPHAEGNVTIRP
jgi:hypothetical protein